MHYRSKFERRSEASTRFFDQVAAHAVMVLVHELYRCRRYFRFWLKADIQARQIAVCL